MSTPLTHLLPAGAACDDQAIQDLFVLVYGELKRLAHVKRRGAPGSGTLDTTGLVHEVFLKLAGNAASRPRDRGHFLAIAATAMRQVLVDHARSRRRQKRGGAEDPVTLDSDAVALEGEADLLLDLDRALGRLSELQPRQARVFECRYFAGLTIEETAEAVGASIRTVEREWRDSRSWLARELGSGAR